MFKRGSWSRQNIWFVPPLTLVGWRAQSKSSFFSISISPEQFPLTWIWVKWKEDWNYEAFGKFNLHSNFNVYAFFPNDQNQSFIIKKGTRVGFKKDTMMTYENIALERFLGQTPVVAMVDCWPSVAGTYQQNYHL